MLRPASVEAMSAALSGPSMTAGVVGALHSVSGRMSAQSPGGTEFGKGMRPNQIFSSDAPTTVLMAVLTLFSVPIMDPERSRTMSTSELTAYSSGRSSSPQTSSRMSPYSGRMSGGVVESSAVTSWIVSTGVSVPVASRS